MGQFRQLEQFKAENQVEDRGGDSMHVNSDSLVFQSLHVNLDSPVVQSPRPGRKSLSLFQGPSLAAVVADAVQCPEVDVVVVDAADERMSTGASAMQCAELGVGAIDDVDEHMLATASATVDSAAIEPSMSVSSRTMAAQTMKMRFGTKPKSAATINEEYCMGTHSDAPNNSTSSSSASELRTFGNKCK